MGDWRDEYYRDEFTLLIRNHPELSEPETFDGQLAQLRAAGAELLAEISRNFERVWRELGL